jgi:Flp pilus assembly protein TadG
MATLCFALFVLIGLVVDGGRAVSARGAAQGVAEQAARVGAGQLSEQDLRLGEVAIDPTAAELAADRYLEEAGYGGSVTASGGIVSVHVTSAEATVILGIVGIDHIGISVTARATNVHGVTRAD